MNRDSAENTPHGTQVGGGSDRIDLVAFFHHKGERMKHTLFVFATTFSILFLTGCSLSLLGLPTAASTPLVMASPTPLSATSTMAASATPVLPSATPTFSLPTVTPGSGVPIATTGLFPTAPPGGSLPGNLSGPYGVIRVAPGDVLNIHSTPGAGSAVNGFFSPTDNSVMRSGPSSNVGGELWVQVQNPGGNTGWVNAAFLTEYIAPITFCADVHVTTLIASLGNAFSSANGELLSSLVSPAHGVTVYQWRNGSAITFDRQHARWVFASTFSHAWGMAPGSGLETNGSFHTVVLPNLQDVFNASHTLTCDSLGSAPQYGSSPWPELYTNVNYYTVFKPGTPGVDLDWRYWLVGVEYVQSQPYVFALIHFAWEP
jgi:hypothetical protein